MKRIIRLILLSGLLCCGACWCTSGKDAISVKRDKKVTWGHVAAALDSLQKLQIRLGKKLTDGSTIGEGQSK